MMRAHRGSGLLEVLVALPLMALLGAVVVQLLLGVHRRVLHADGVAGASRELRHGAAVLAAELRVIRASDLVVWSDTAVEFEGLVGVGVACATNANRAQLLLGGTDASMTSGEPVSVVWNQPPQSGDRADVWLAGATLTDSLRPASGSVQSVTVGNDCARSPLTTVGGETTRLTLSDTVTGAVAAGTPVRLSRRTRYSLYRSSDGDWYLGRRTRGKTGWDVVQPVAGPLRSPRDGGLVVRVYDRMGTALDGASVRAAARVSVQVRAPRRAGRAALTVVTVDSLHIDVALRANGSKP